MKLGICCVYFFRPDSEWLLDLQLRYIRETLEGYDYTVYAGAIRLRPELRPRLEREERLEIVSLPHFEGIDNAEHAFYLDALLRHAAKDGCTHLAALDCDSFPVCGDWPRILRSRMEGKRLAAVHRTENLDTFLPHPCGLFMERSFLLDHDPKMLPPREAIADFLAATRQRFDTGIGYGHALWKSGESWLSLERTNRKNVHYLMAGIYGDTFFHVGASSRPSIHFYAEDLKSPHHKLNSIPVLWRCGSWLHKRESNRNIRLLARISDALKKNPDRFLSSLRNY